MDYYTLMWVFLSCLLASVVATVLFAGLPSSDSSSKKKKKTTVNANANINVKAKTNTKSSSSVSSYSSSSLNSQDDEYDIDKGQSIPRSVISRLTKFGVTTLDEVHHTYPLRLPPKLVLVTDLDHTLFGVGYGETLQQVQSYINDFNRLWCRKYAANNCVLIYATGRSLDKYQIASREYTNLLKPDILICKDGVDVYWFNKHLASLVQMQSTHQIEWDFNDEMEDHEFIWFDRSWESTLKEGWNQKFAESLHHEWKEKHKMPPLPEGSHFLEPFRIAVMTYTMNEAMEAKEFFLKRVEEYNQELRKKGDTEQPPMEIHSFYCIERGTDHWWAALCPARAGKGCAVDWVRQRLHCETGENFVVCGDSGNDISMLSLPKYHAVIVQNCSRELQDYYEAHRELKGKYIYLSKKNRTRGVIEGLEYFGKKISESWDIPDQ